MWRFRICRLSSDKKTFLKIEFSVEPNFEDSFMKDFTSSDLNVYVIYTVHYTDDKN
jgi:hypothetical protein